MNKLIILEGLLDYLFSFQAIVIYLIIILVMILLIIIRLISLAHKRVEDQIDQLKGQEKNSTNTAVNVLSSHIDDLMKPLNDRIEKFGVDSNYISKGFIPGEIGFTEEEKLKNLDRANKSRFYMLTTIDEGMQNYVEPEYNETISLKEFCEEFRDYSSYKLHLYYDIKDIRRFVAGLAVTRLIILQGMSGTGKTSLAYAFGEFVENKTVVVPIQPMWKERSDLIGYYNEFTKKFNETTLLYKMYEALYTRDIYVTVLDEMNIARVEYYFAEFLSLFELPNPDSRNLDVVSDVWDNDPVLLRNGKLRLPLNMYFIGTANNDDSTFAISDKVYDRAIVLNLDNKCDPFEAKRTSPVRISWNHINDLFYKARQKYELSYRNLRRINELDKYLIDKFNITFGNRIMKQIKEYVPVIIECGGTELDAIDDIVSRKILRKLESKNPVYVKSQSEALINKLNDLFGDNKMSQCINVINQLLQS
jgi:RNAse (barnase) inhibitor barstar